MSRNLHNTDYIFQPKRGLDAALNTTASKNAAVAGELAYTTDKKQLNVFNGTEFEPVNKYTEYIFNSSGSQTGARFNTWSDLYATIRSNNNGSPARITFEQNESIAFATNAIMDGIRFRGNGTSVLLGGLTITVNGGNVSSWAGGSMESIGIIWNSSSPMYTLDASEVYTFVLEAGSAFLRTGSAHMFDVTASGAFLIVAVLDGSSVVGSAFGGSPIADVGANGAWVLALSGSGTNVDNDIITGTASGAGKGITYVWSDSSPEIDGLTATNSAFSGGYNYDFYAKAKLVKYDNTASGLTATDVQDAIDELKALIDSYHP